ncbi:globin domain-containing protein [Thalassovita sp.]|uniref:globin domain-containing protein n=1 Tax=Thalassovita sp. TaxID=1979401 RepID=UPI0029DE510D|nr:globin domain-containing protein [Thalassovita sp.]
MNQRNLYLIRLSFPLIFLHKAEIAARFYDRLFELAPQVRRLFRADLGAQKEMLAMVLTMLAKASFDAASVQGMIARLARSHGGLGITQAQFRAGETALSEALEQVVGSKVDAETLAAWQLAVRRVIQAMIDPPEP